MSTNRQDTSIHDRGGEGTDWHEVPGALIPARSALAVGPPAADMEAAAALMGASMATSMVTAYARDWKAWVTYAEAHGLDPLPADPAHVCAFLASYAVDRKASTTQRAAMAIGKAHRLAGIASPVDHEHVRRTLAGLRRTKGDRGAPGAAVVHRGRGPPRRCHHR